MWSRFTSHLYVRIWLAVVATVVVLAFLVGAAWHAVWANTDLPKTFVAEYERYHANGDISISIGLAAN